MASLKEKFLDGCVANGVTPAVAQQLWEDTEKSQDYSFNKSHAACYALIAYRTAWLKANHPCEYMAALISSVMNTKDRVPFYVNACDELGIEVLPPDVNSSQTDFAVVEGKIRFGLTAVKNVGDTAAERSSRAREDGPFASIWDFTERVDPQVVNKRALESLVKCGALDSAGATRLGMLAVLEQALGLGARLHRPPARAGVDLRRRFGDAETAEDATIRRSPPASSRSGSCSGWRRRLSVSTCPSIRCRACASSSAAKPTRPSPSWSDGATARSSRSAASSPGSSR